MQIEGCDMGASISSFITQLVLKDLEECTINNMDFDLYNSNTKRLTEKIKNQFNNYHRKLQFTIETE